MYCNTIELYCERGARQGWTVLQYSAQPSHNIVTVAATQGAGMSAGARRRACRGAGCAGRRWALGGRALGVRACWARATGGRAGVGRRGARSAADARGRRQAAGAGCAGRADEQARARQGATSVGAWSAGRRRAAWAPGLAGAVHLVHSAVFCPVRLSIFPSQIFFYIVHEPGS